MRTYPPSGLILAVVALVSSTTLAPGIEHDRAKKRITMADGAGDLVLRLSYDGRCMLDRVVVRGKDAREHFGVVGVNRPGRVSSSRR